MKRKPAHLARNSVEAQSYFGGYLAGLVDARFAAEGLDLSCLVDLCEDGHYSSFRVELFFGPTKTSAYAEIRFNEAKRIIGNLHAADGLIEELRHSFEMWRRRQAERVLRGHRSQLGQ